MVVLVVEKKSTRRAPKKKKNEQNEKVKKSTTESRENRRKTLRNDYFQAQTVETFDPRNGKAFGQETFLSFSSSEKANAREFVRKK